MLLLSNEDVAKVLDLPACLAMMEAGYHDLASGEVAYGRSDLFAFCDRSDGYFGFSTMQGAIKHLGMVTIRLKSDIFYWPGGQITEEKYCMEPGTYFGLILLVSTGNAEPLAIIHDGYIQHMRMAASAGLGVKYLARADASTVGILGSGGMARTFLPSFCAVRDIKRAKVYSPTQAHREAYAEEMSRSLGIPVEAVGTPEEAVRGVDILSLCTDSTESVFSADWLEPGMHVVTVRLEESPGVQQRADVSMRLGWGAQGALSGSERVGRFAVYLGDRAEFERFPREGSHTSPLSHIQMEDLVTGKVSGRTDDRQITYFITEGTQGIQITAAAAEVYKRAREHGVGRELPTEWFTQHIRD